MIRCLVTGASGFVGSHLCCALADLGMHVTGIDMRPPKASVRKMIHYAYGDLVTGEGLDSLPWSSFNVVFHLAAAGVKAVAREWQDCIQVNILGTLHLIEQLESASPAPSLVYTHTFYEDFIAFSPSLAASPYVMSKFAASQIVRALARHYLGSVVMTKVFQIYGAGDASSNLLPYVLACLKNDKPAFLGSGEGLRDWLYIDDITTGLIACWQAGVPGELREFDLGSGCLVSIKDVVLQLANILGKPTQLLDFDASRDRGDIMAAEKAEHWPDNWHPLYDLKRGLMCMACEN